MQVGVGIALGQPTYGAGYGSRDAGRYGYDRGSREGAREGYEDGRNGHRFNIVHDGDYRDADDGYKGWMGARHVYMNAFQRGFAESYRRAFDQGSRDRRVHEYRRYDNDAHDRW